LLPGNGRERERGVRLFLGEEAGLGTTKREENGHPEKEKAVVIISEEKKTGP